MKIPTFFDFSVEKTSVFLKEADFSFSFRKTEGSEIKSVPKVPKWGGSAVGPGSRAWDAV